MSQIQIAPWYAKTTAGGHQGLVIDEKTGATVALTYDPAHAPLVAELPAMLEALRWIEDNAHDPVASKEYAHINADKLREIARRCSALLSRIDGDGAPSRAAAEPVYLAVTIEGGIVQAIHSNKPEAFAFVEDVLLIDFDTEGADEGSTFQVPELKPSEFGPSEAHGGAFSITESELDLAAVSRILNGEEESE